jgi:hypothetical protein
MKGNARRLVVLFLLSLFAARASAQTDKITIPAGTPEDRDLQAISNEQDAAKKLTMYQDFVKKYSSNPRPSRMGTVRFRRRIRPRAI